MNDSTILRVVRALVAAVALLGGGAFAAVPEGVDRAQLSEIASGSRLAQLREQAQQLTGPDDESGSLASASSLLAEAIDHEQRAVDRASEALERLAQARAFENLRRQFAEEKAAAAPEVFDRWARALPATMEFGELQRRLDTERTEIVQLRRELEATNAELERLRRRPAEIPAEIRRIEERIEASAAETVDDGTRLAQAQRALSQSRARRRAVDIALRRIELAQSDQRIALAELRSAALEARLALALRRQQLLDARLAAAAGQEVAELAQRLHADVLRAAEHPRLAALAARNRELGQELGELMIELTELSRKTEVWRQQREEAELALATTRERLELGFGEAALGSLLLSEQQRARQLSEQRFRLAPLRREIAMTRLRLIDLRQPRVERSIGEAVGDAELEPSSEPAGLRAELEQTRRDLETRLKTALQQRIVRLEQAEAALTEMLVPAAELSRLLDAQLLWLPSHPPLSKTWFSAHPRHWARFFEPRQWQLLGDAVQAVTLQRPVSSLGWLLAAMLIAQLGRRRLRRLPELAEQARHPHADRYGLTLEVLATSVLRALPVPMLLSVLAARLRGLPEANAQIEATAAALLTAAAWWFAARLMYSVARPDGLGCAHFGWSASLAARWRRHLRWLAPAILGCILAIALSFVHAEPEAFSHIGRLVMAVAPLLLAVFVWRVLRPEGEPVRPRTSLRMVRLAAALIAAAALLLAASGYLFTLANLLDALTMSLIALALVWLGHALARRWLLLGERRLRWARLREQYQAQAQDQEGADGANPGATAPEITLEDVSLQARTVVDLSAGTVLLLWLLSIWAPLLPALQRLNDIVLWHSQHTVDGQTVSDPVTLAAVLVGLLIGAVLLLAARNLPGLLELLLLRRLSADASLRYAITTVLRYVLVLAAVTVVFTRLGFRWTELQWAVAALSVGLGFGLGEIVANFVSGLVVLFERPIRVGDTVTVGEFSGRVVRIRSRATTLLDWDNRETVIPNKAFLTEKLVNWTLSNTTTRITIPVGVSYASDPRQVEAELLAIGRAHPAVLADPEPVALFLRFGASSLDFELRCWVPELRDRLRTTHDLHVAITERFREVGIEIAYPQMDLHLRSGVLEHRALDQALPGR